MNTASIHPTMFTNISDMSIVFGFRIVDEYASQWIEEPEGAYKSIAEFKAKFPDDAVGFFVIGPDEIPTTPEPFPSYQEAKDSIQPWCERYKDQGYYSGIAGRIPLKDLPGQMRIEADEEQDED